MNEFWNEGEPLNDKTTYWLEKSRQAIERKLMSRSMTAVSMEDWTAPIFKPRKTVDELADELINLL